MSQNDRVQILQGLDQAFAADQVLLAAAGDIPAADIAVVGFDGREYVPDRQTDVFTGPTGGSVSLGVSPG